MPTPTPGPSRSPEAVADGVAAAFQAKDADALRHFLSECVTTAAASGGAGFVSRERYAADLRAAFAAGLGVTVLPRPLEGDRGSGSLTAKSTWPRRAEYTRARPHARADRRPLGVVGTIERPF
ncbi:MAG: hypothetical protein ACRDF0_00425 [Candidatus Limnocylindria bacterium]